MTKKIGVLMDPIGDITAYKDSTLAMLLEVQRRGWEPVVMTLSDVFVENGVCQGQYTRVEVRDDPDDWFTLGEPTTAPLHHLDALLMRKDPPFDMEYIYATYALELAEGRGLLVVNRPQSLRDFNEKFSTTLFPQCCPETLVTRDPLRLRAFVGEHEQAVIKPLDEMGGSSVFKTARDDQNLGALVEMMTHHGQRTVMIQRFIPEITAGDKRILLVNGEVIPYGLARIPAPGEFRGNLAAGATGRGVELSERDLWICQQIGPALAERGLVFVGIDVIGDYLTEINVTSPTGIRELDKLFDLNTAKTLFDAVERLLNR
ncbi:MAG: glutathione synthase [Deltaproteobacteria bacterium]|nr:glutathione synthase [Deltaproteobacteria bacterium]